MATLPIVLIISALMLQVCHGQMVSTINGETYFNQVPLGRGHHQINTITKDGQSYYQVETTRQGEPTTVQLLPAPPGSFVQISIGNSGGGSPYVYQGQTSRVTLPDIPAVVIPAINTPLFTIPQITIPGWTGQSFNFSY